MMNMTMVIMMIVVMAIHIMIRRIINKEIRAMIVIMGRIAFPLPFFVEQTN
ncbi:hypothetical protein HQN90_06150 [Paenibacillus alba]|nr:hypothetical protein [Paenibacillus alba]